MILWWIDSPRHEGEEEDLGGEESFGLGWDGRLTPKESLGRGKILWVVSASIFLLVARCRSHVTEPHSISSNGFRKRTQAAYDLRGSKATRVPEDGYGVDRVTRGSLGPVMIFFTRLEGTFGVLCRHTGCGPSRGPTALQW